MRRYIVLAIIVLSFSLSGCFSGSSDGGSDPISTGLNYYYDEFSDVAIPREMSPDKKETFITFNTTGVKLGTLMVTGRVELASLVDAMRGHMQRDGWSLRSVFRSSRSIIIFEKADRMCSMYLSEGMLTTEMLIFVSLRLADGALQYSVPAASAPMEAPMPSDPPISSGSGFSGSTAPSAPANGNVTVYPAGGFSGGTVAQ